ncbi:ABC transporter ATP-binding protein [Acrocarpospora phusangensis]|uniref:ABC transporter ATP-binding protein n=1 Tax=Acrocarpospora phusangensis TaxID=1070424 RepID=A0A919Q6I9_9ACTN|nr:ABC transporter ATP-binding protein [Acrocarpospora phusangensis]GIH22149.1 ABC transporter ATP-binding protein [Acrocarpospora phusangensis]
MRAAARVLARAVTREPGRAARLAAWSVAEVAPSFVIGLALAGAIDDGFGAGEPMVGLVWVGVLGLSWVVAAVGARQALMALAGIVEPFRERLAAGVVRDALAGGRVEAAAVTRSNLQVEVARDAFATVLGVLRSFVFTLVSVALGLAALMPEVLVLVLAPFALGLGLFLLSLPALARRQRAFLVADERTTEWVTVAMGALRDVTACGAEERTGELVGRRIDEQAAAAGTLARVTAVRTFALGLGGWAPVLLVLAFAPGLGASPGMVVGIVAAVLQSLTPALNGLVEGLGVSGVRLMVTLERLMGDRPAAGPDRLTPPDVRVELSGATFRYGPHADPVVSDLDLTVPEGEHLAVVGPSGIGKSTLAALITGLVQPGEGTVTVGGVAAERVDPAARVLIPQEAYVFRGTLWDNLTYLSVASESRVDGAVAEVGADGLVQRLGGYQAEIHAAELTPGERQLVALVRAYLSPARLTILDESTCHLDPAAEARAEEAFARRGGTLIVIAHRLTSAMRAQRILVLDGAEAVSGTHADLLRTSRLYADLAGQWDPDLEQVS